MDGRAVPGATAPDPLMASYWIPRVLFAPEVTVNPGGGSGWDEPPLDIQIPDDARELDREVLAYHRELRAKRRRNRLRRLAATLRRARAPSCRCWPASWPCAWWQARCCRWPRSARRRRPATTTPSRRRRPRPCARAAAVERRAPARHGHRLRPTGPAPPGASASGTGASASGASRASRSASPVSLLDPAEPRRPRRHPASDAQPEPRVNPRRRDRYDFFRSDGS